MNKIFCIFFSFVFLNASAKYYSQSQQDKYLNERIFHGKRDGVFIDIGAHDGITYNNTLFFEKHLNWTGICIEPIPSVFAELKKNRQCICIHGCISNTEGIAQFLKISGYSEMLSGLMNTYDPRHLDRINKELQLHGGKKEVLEIKCFRLDNVLKDHGIQYVDYLSVDTEGAELAVLQSINFEEIYIDIIGVENNYGGKSIRNFLTKKGYKFISKVGADEIYRKKT